MNCPNCQQNLQNDFRFCPYCGSEVNRGLFCPSCGNKVEQNWVSCPQCGSALKGITSRQAPQQQIPRPEHQPYGYRHSSTGGKHRRKKGFLGGLFSS